MNLGKQKRTVHQDTAIRKGRDLIAYYTQYADHMWRFYVRNLDADLTAMSEPSAANWTACDAVYTGMLGHTRQAIVRVYYAGYPTYTDRDRAVLAFCRDHCIVPETVGAVIRNVQMWAAEKRGLIDPLPAEWTSRKAEAAAIKKPGPKAETTKGCDSNA